MFYLNGFLLVYPQAVHEPQNLLVVLSDGGLVLLAWRVENGSLGRNLDKHPLVLLNLSNRQPFGWVQDQHSPDEMLALCWEEPHVTHLQSFT